MFNLLDDFQDRIRVPINNNNVSGWIIFQNASAFRPYSPWNIERDFGGAALHLGTTARCSYISAPITTEKDKQVTE